MSIYVYVTRKPDPLEAGGPDISEEEWIGLIESDPDLSIADPPKRLPGDRGTYAVWTSYPGGYRAWFSLCGGNIEVKGIDEAILSKLRHFAGRLGARIVSKMREEFS